MDAVREIVTAPGARAGAGDTLPDEGNSWLRRELAILGMLMVLFAAQIPLLDPDLPMHLALGEWIVRHGRVPFEEPFAWTRAGQPFHAYSWLPETVFYLVHRALGPVGLRLLQGGLLVGTGAATAFLGLRLRWQPGTVLLTSAMTMMVSGMVVPALRPQIMLAIVLPVVWALVWRITEGEGRPATFLGLTLWSALLANSHIFFVLTVVPLSLFWIRDRWSWRLVALSGLAIVAGWFLSPYGLHWPEVFRANFAGNLLLQEPSPIGELRPGFVAITNPYNGKFLPAGVLLLAPWLLRHQRHTGRELLGAAGLWMVGLVGFGYAGRLLILWWLFFLPFLGWVIEGLSGRSAEPEPPPRPAFRYTAYGLLVALALVLLWREGDGWRREGTTTSRRLATGPAAETEAIATWLDGNLRPEARGRLYTLFNYGSYLTWRLPMLSPSLDGRTIFPDSVAAVEAYFRPSRRPVPVGPWREADVAIIGTFRSAAGVLDTASGWRRVAVTLPPPQDPGEPPPVDSVALWVREAWWARAGLRPLPDRPVVLSNERR